jgi:hypothetical protein
LKVEIEKKKKTKSIRPDSFIENKLKKNYKAQIPSNLILNDKIEEKS